MEPYSNIFYFGTAKFKHEFFEVSKSQIGFGRVLLGASATASGLTMQNCSKQRLKAEITHSAGPTPKIWRINLVLYK